MSAPRLTARGQGFLASGIAIAVLAMLFGLPDITRVGVLLTTMPVLAMVTSWRRVPQLRVQRSVDPPLLHPGERARVRAELRNTGRGRTLLHLAEERVDPALGSGPRALLPRLGPGERHAMTYEIRATHRGRYGLGPLSLRQEDPFGLTSSRAEIAGRSDVVVLPAVETLDPTRPRGRGLGQEGQVAAMVAVHGEDDASIRAYRDGDDLRRVHWAATAHRGELMVRQEDRPARRRTVLVLDTRRAVHRGTGARSSLEWAVSALASVAVHLAGQGYVLHLMCPETVRDGTAERPMSLGEVLQRLALAAPSEDAELDPLLRPAHGVIGDGALVVAVTTDHDRTGLERLATVRSPGTVGVLLLLEAASFDDDALPRPATAPVGPAGWRTAVARRGDTVRSCWAGATTAEPLAATP